MSRRRRFTSLPILLYAFFLLIGGAGAQQFTRVTTGAIATDVEDSAGCTWADYNDDGQFDLFILNWQQNNSLYRNNGDLTFSKLTAGPLVNDGGRSKSGSWGDYDNDGCIDLFVPNEDGENNFLYHSNCDGTFTKITTGAIVTNGGDSEGGAGWSDYDHDGHLDLFVANNGNNFLYHNNGDGSFERILSGPVVTDGRFSNSAAWGDYDNDGLDDLFVANVTDNNLLYHNEGGGSFGQVITGPVVTDGAISLGGDWVDYDNDGDLDLFVVNHGYNALYRNEGNGEFIAVTTGELVNSFGNFESASWGDYDNDGDQDVFIARWNDNDNQLYANNGDGTFTRITAGDPVNDGGLSTAVTWMDHDNDGDLDLLVSNWGQANFFYTNNGTPNNWVTITCVGSLSNASAIGAKVRVTATIGTSVVTQLQEVTGQSGPGSQMSLRLHFGLGDATVVDLITIEWPSGTVQELGGLLANQFMQVLEPDAGHIDPPFSPALPAEPLRVSCHPNPFQTTAAIHFQSSGPIAPRIEIFTINGLLVRVLAARMAIATGACVAHWDGRDAGGRLVPGGIYVCRGRAGERTMQGTLTRLR